MEEYASELRAQGPGVDQETQYEANEKVFPDFKALHENHREKQLSKSPTNQEMWNTIYSQKEMLKSEKKL